MKITMYELLGMVKDGKAPKKIKVNGTIYYFDEEFNFYFTKAKKGRVALGGKLNEINLLYNFNNENVEILEEEKKLPEKSNIDFNTKLPVSGCSENEAFMMTCISHLGNTIDKLIDYIKSKGE